MVELSIDCKKEVGRITEFIHSTVYAAGFAKLAIGLSGGIDSAVSCAMATRAIGSENIHVGIFPYGQLNKEGVEDAQLVADFLKIPRVNRHLIDIQPCVDPIINSASDPVMAGESGSLRKGNIMVRTRMILLFDLAKRENALVLGTENKTEHLLGYFTRFGDEASDVEPIRNLYKTQVRQLASYLRIPQKIIGKTPTAGMWAGQTDEGEFGFTYEDADKILTLYRDKKKTAEEIGKEGFKKEVIEKVLNRMEANAFKHQLPYVEN